MAALEDILRKVVREELERRLGPSDSKEERKRFAEELFRWIHDERNHVNGYVDVRVLVAKIEKGTV